MTPGSNSIAELPKVGDPLTGPAQVVSGTVVHLVGRMTDAVFSFLGPATEAVAALGARQLLLTLDDVHCRRLVLKLPPSVEVVAVDESGGPLRRWRGLYKQFRAATKGAPLAAVHLHGLLPSLIGAWTLRGRSGARVPLYFSPHGSKSLGALRAIGAPLIWTLGSLPGHVQLPIVNAPADARILARLTGRTPELVESPVGEAFLSVERREARRPLVVSGGAVNGAARAERFVQLAVLMSDVGLGVSFNWVGPTDATSAAVLKAAAVGSFDEEDDATRAVRLSAAWVYVAVSESRGFPIALAEAMAVGLPCVALDAVPYRDLIEDGVTGFLCRTPEQMLKRIAQLIDDAPLRESIGAAARAEARRRFSGDHFSRRLLAVYEVEDARTEVTETRVA